LIIYNHNLEPEMLESRSKAQKTWTRAKKIFWLGDADFLWLTS